MYTAGVGKLRPAGQLRPGKGKSVARGHVFILKGMRPERTRKKFLWPASMYMWPAEQIYF